MALLVAVLLGALPLASGRADDVQDALSAAELQKLFDGATERGVGYKGDQETGRRWTAFSRRADDEGVRADRAGA